MNKQSLPRLFAIGCLLAASSAPLVHADATPSAPKLQNYGRNGQGSRLGFHWEGIVDGTVQIRLRRRQVDIERVNGLPVQRQHYEVVEPLPSTQMNLELNVIEGRGRVRITQQPRPDNGFTAIVRIEDNDGGRSRYEFELSWDDRGRRDDWNGRDNGGNSSFDWSGRVDDEVRVFVRGRESWTEAVRGQRPNGERSNFSSSLPRRTTQVNLVNTRGRGEVILLEQPSDRNDYTAVVRIRDRQSGAGDYSFTLNWAERGGRDRDWADNRDTRGDDRRGDSYGSNERGLVWSGRVDGRDVIRISESRLTVEHQNGAPVMEQDYRFYRSLPYERRTVTVNKRRGRGTVRVLEQPSRENNYTATILVEDKDGGSDNYEIEVFW